MTDHRDISPTQILVVDDEPSHRDSLRRIFERAGFAVLTAGNGEEALQHLRANDVSMVLSDLVMPKMDGHALLNHIKNDHSDVEVVVMTAYGTVKNAVQAMRDGAYDFVSKPVKRNELLACVKRVLEKRALVVENRELKSRLSQIDSHRELVGQSRPMTDLRSTIAQVAPSTASVFLGGEAGTGKENCARTIHELSPRKTEPFVSIDCAALPEPILEAEIFGRAQPEGNKNGRLLKANGGTAFLNQVGALPLTAQIRLLKVLNEGILEPIDSTANHSVDVRIVVAHDSDLQLDVQAGKFREDLYYRLDIIHIDMPALRDRAGDIPLIAGALVQRYGERHGKPIRHVEERALDALSAWSWPGNVRELENVVERSVVLCPSDTLRAEDLPENIRQNFMGTATPKNEQIQFRVGSTMEQLERAAIDATLRHTDGDKTHAAKLLGISARTLYRRLGRDDPGALEDDS